MISTRRFFEGSSAESSAGRSENRDVMENGKRVRERDIQSVSFIVIGKSPRRGERTYPASSNQATRRCRYHSARAAARGKQRLDRASGGRIQAASWRALKNATPKRLAECSAGNDCLSSRARC